MVLQSSTTWIIWLLCLISNIYGSHTVKKMFEIEWNVGCGNLLVTGNVTIKEAGKCVFFQTKYIWLLKFVKIQMCFYHLLEFQQYSAISGALGVGQATITKWELTRSDKNIIQHKGKHDVDGRIKRFEIILETDCGILNPIGSVSFF